MKKSDKTNEYQPSDSAKETPQDKLVVKKERDKTYKKEKAILSDPEKKRKFSEQPPTKHNTHN